MKAKQTEMLTFSIEYLDLQDPEPTKIHLADIAVGLGRECRYSNQCPSYYSVAEHSVLMVQMALDDGCSNDCLKAILLHDAHEAYLGDVSKPQKALMPQYVLLSARFDAAIESRFGVNFAEHADAIHKYDLLMLRAEKAAMWPDDNTQWPGLDDVELRHVAFRWLLPHDARFMFSAVARNLCLVEA